MVRGKSNETNKRRNQRREKTEAQRQTSTHTYKLTNKQTDKNQTSKQPERRIEFFSLAESPSELGISNARRQKKHDEKEQPDTSRPGKHAENLSTTHNARQQSRARTALYDMSTDFTLFADWDRLLAAAVVVAVVLMKLLVSAMFGNVQRRKQKEGTKGEA